MASGDSTTLGVQLEPGHYAIICKITGHHQSGMHAEVNVT